MEEILLGTQRIANQFNSNEAFQPESTFQADLTVIQCPIEGGKGKFTLGKRAVSDVTRQKRSVIEIKKYRYPSLCTRYLCYENLAAQR